MPGVHAVITWEDVPLLSYGHLSALGIPEDEPLLAKDALRYKGQPIAARRCGRRGRPRWKRSRRSRSSFAEKPALFDVRLAADPGAPVVHHWGNWYPHFEGEMDRRQIRKGDIDWALRPGRRDRPGRLPSCRHRALPARDSGLPGRARGGRPLDDLHVLPGALLLDGRRRGAPRGAAEQAQARGRHGRRRLRREGGHGDRDDDGAARHEVRPAGEVALDARGGVPLLVDARGRGTWRSRTRSRATAGSSAARC